mmetsp:Transcript_63642/g.105825  ORF Transcript_63642/g.105825 Transcript_63642/m.105825 type:complete len:121 (+) Transcript_63642:232-594(+)
MAGLVTVAASESARITASQHHLKVCVTTACAFAILDSQGATALLRAAQLRRVHRNATGTAFASTARNAIAVPATQATGVKFAHASLIVPAMVSAATDSAGAIVLTRAETASGQSLGGKVH